MGPQGTRTRAQATAAILGLILAGGMGQAQNISTGTPVPAVPAAESGTGSLLAGPQIITLDQDRLYADSLFGRALEKASADAVAALVAENHKIEADLTTEEKALTDQRALLSAEAFKPLAEAFDVKVEGIRAAQEAKSKALQDSRDAGRKRFFNAALPVLAGLMRERGALAILNKNAVVLSFDSIDATDAAIAAINSTLGSGAGAVLAPAPDLAPAPVLPPAPGPDPASALDPPAAPAP